MNIGELTWSDPDEPDELEKIVLRVRYQASVGLIGHPKLLGSQKRFLVSSTRF